MPNEAKFCDSPVGLAIARGRGYAQANSNELYSMSDAGSTDSAGNNLHSFTVSNSSSDTQRAHVVNSSQSWDAYSHGVHELDKSGDSVE